MDQPQEQDSQRYHGSFQQRYDILPSTSTYLNSIANSQVNIFHEKKSIFLDQKLLKYVCLTFTSYRTQSLRTIYVDIEAIKIESLQFNNEIVYFSQLSGAGSTSTCSLRGRALPPSSRSLLEPWSSSTPWTTESWVRTRDLSFFTSDINFCFFDSRAPPQPQVPLVNHLH